MCKILKCIQPPRLLYTQCKYDGNFMIEVKILRKTHKICHHTVYFVHKSVGQSLALNSSRCWPAVKQFDSSFNYRQHLFCVERMIYSFANIQQFPSLIRIFHSNPFVQIQNHAFTFERDNQNMLYQNT